MPRFKSILLTLILIVSAFFRSFLLPSEALAKDEVLSQAEISEYTAKLVQGRSIQSLIANQVASLEKRDAVLTSQSNALEKELGELRRQEQELAGQLMTRNATYEEFKQNYRRENEKYNRLRSELQYYLQQQHAQDKQLREIQEALGWFIPSFLKDKIFELEKSLGEVLGVIQSHKGKINETERRLNTAQNGLNDAEKRFHESENEYGQTKQILENTKASVSKTENEIQKLKAMLFELRDNVQSNRLLFDDFENGLKEAEAVDTADDRARTARTVRRMSSDIDKTVASSIAIIERANLILPEEYRQSYIPR